MKDKNGFGTGLSIKEVRKVTYFDDVVNCIANIAAHAQKRMSGFYTMQICNLLTSKSKAM